MGALTSKPFSFAARSWELLDRLAFDCTDTFFSSIKVSFRGKVIMRVLPDFTANLLSEWISDRVRFSYDSLQDQADYDLFYKFRINNVSHNFLSFFLRRFPVNSYFFDFISAHQIKAFADFSGFCGRFFDKFSYLNFDNRESYSFDFFQILSKQAFKNYFLFGVNFRYQLPVFTVHLRKLANSSETFFFNFGFFTNNLLGDVNFGSSIKVFQATIRGKSRISRIYHSPNSVAFANPLLYPFISSYSRSLVYTFFDSPKSLISADVFSVFTNFESPKLVNISLPHFFLSGQVFPRNGKLQKFDSPVLSSERFHDSYFFSKRFAFFKLSNSSNFKINSSFFLYDNYYSHYSLSPFSTSSLNILLSLKRQSSSRSNFTYYN